MVELEEGGWLCGPPVEAIEAFQLQLLYRIGGEFLTDAFYSAGCGPPSLKVTEKVRRKLHSVTTTVESSPRKIVRFPSPPGITLLRRRVQY